MAEAQTLDRAIPRQRLLLATIAARGILNHNTAVDLPDRFSLKRLQELLPGYRPHQLEGDLSTLTEQGALSKWNTGHKGYANSWIEGVDVWYVTAEGLVALWTTAPSS